MARGTKKPKADLVFRDLLMNPSFKTDVTRLRKRFKIDEDGFLDIPTQRNWFEKLVGKYRKFLDAYERIIKRHNISPMFMNKVEDYILNKNRLEIYPSHPDVFCAIDKSGKNVKITIYDYAKKGDVTKYIKDNWDTIEEGWVKRWSEIFKPSKKEEKYKVVSDAYEKAKKDRKISKKDSHIPAINLATRILREQNKMNVTPEYVNTASNRHKKNLHNK